MGWTWKSRKAAMKLAKWAAKDIDPAVNEAVFCFFAVISVLKEYSSVRILAHFWEIGLKKRCTDYTFSHFFAQCAPNAAIFSNYCALLASLFEIYLISFYLCLLSGRAMSDLLHPVRFVAVGGAKW